MGKTKGAVAEMIIIRALHIVLEFSLFKYRQSFLETATKSFLPNCEKKLTDSESENHGFVDFPTMCTLSTATIAYDWSLRFLLWTTAFSILGKIPVSFLMQQNCLLSSPLFQIFNTKSWNVIFDLICENKSALLTANPVNTNGETNLEGLCSSYALTEGHK